MKPKSKATQGEEKEQSSPISGEQVEIKEEEKQPTPPNPQDPAKKEMMNSADEESPPSSKNKSNETKGPKKEAVLQAKQDKKEVTAPPAVCLTPTSPPKTTSHVLSPAGGAPIPELSPYPPPNLRPSFSPYPVWGFPAHHSYYPPPFGAAPPSATARDTGSQNLLPKARKGGRDKPAKMSGEGDTAEESKELVTTASVEERGEQFNNAGAPPPNDPRGGGQPYPYYAGYYPPPGGYYPPPPGYQHHQGPPPPPHDQYPYSPLPYSQAQPYPMYCPGPHSPLPVYLNDYRGGSAGNRSQQKHQPPHGASAVPRPDSAAADQGTQGQVSGRRGVRDKATNAKATTNTPTSTTEEQKQADKNDEEATTSTTEEQKKADKNDDEAMDDEDDVSNSNSVRHETRNSFTTSILSTYIRPKVVSKELLDRRSRKNQQARARAQKRRNIILEIEREPEEDRTPEKVELLERDHASRERKNERSRRRATELRVQLHAILAKPEHERVKQELRYLNVHTHRKTQKNDGDRLRRHRLKELGFSKADIRTMKKPGISARGPLPEEYQQAPLEEDQQEEPHDVQLDGSMQHHESPPVRYSSPYYPHHHYGYPPPPPPPHFPHGAEEGSLSFTINNGRATLAYQPPTLSVYPSYEAHHMNGGWGVGDPGKGVSGTWSGSSPPGETRDV